MALIVVGIDWKMILFLRQLHCHDGDKFYKTFACAMQRNELLQPRRYFRHAMALRAHKFRKKTFSVTAESFGEINRIGTLLSARWCRLIVSVSLAVQMWSEFLFAFNLKLSPFRLLWDSFEREKDGKLRNLSIFVLDEGFINWVLIRFPLLSPTIALKKFFSTD